MGRNESGGSGRFVFLIAVAVLLSSLSVQAKEIRVLFVGNSLTFANDLPHMVETIARKEGVRLHAAMVAAPNFSLEDHWMAGKALPVIASGRWDFVVLQQGPSALESSRENLLEWTTRFAGEIRRAGATPALYMVWPSSQRTGDFDRVVESYRQAAEKVEGILLPAGRAWQIAWAHDSSIALYGDDGFHPSPLGTWLAAVVIFERITGKVPARAARDPVSKIDDSLRAVLVAAAHEAVADSR